MDMPYHLKTLPPEALDILRYFGSLNAPSALADDIVEGSGLSNKGFGKAIRRLVTNGTLTMDASQVYRVTDRGQRLIEDLLAYEQAQADQPQETAPRLVPRFVKRRLVVALPRKLLAGQATNLFIGVDEAGDDSLLHDSTHMLLRVEVLNGDTQPTESSFLLSNRSVRLVIETTARRARMARVRVQVFQLSDDTGEYEACGGLYVDVPIVTDAASADSSLVAYGSDVMVLGLGTE
jgi:predicted transcriptional regulator